MLKSLLQSFSVTTSTLQDIPNFPYEDWERLQATYEDADNWFSGEELENLSSQAGIQTDLYPMRLNPLPGTAAKHVATLFGEYEDDGRPLVYPKIITQDETQLKRAEEIEEILYTLWAESSGRSLMLQNGFLSQIYGGCIWKATYSPWDTWPASNKIFPITIEAPHPKTFVGYPTASNDFYLGDAWIVREYSTVQAREYGYTGTETKVLGVEHWRPDFYETFMDGKPAVRSGIELKGENPFKFVPIVYIPHMRESGFYGSNIIDNVKNILKELNRAWGDLGDAINDDSHPITAVRNIQGQIQVKRINEWITVVDLGSVSGIATNEAQPDMFEVNKPRASSAMTTVIGETYKQYRRDAFVPPVADGEDEGSQRSGVTLDIRFWPLISHTKLERIHWSSGMNVFQSMLLRILAVKSLGGITEQETKMRMKQKWPPQLPRDRTAQVDEWTKRASSKIGSIETLLEATGDIEDIPRERQRILQWEKDLLALETESEVEVQETKNEGLVDAAEAQSEGMIARAEATPAPAKKPAPKKPAGGAK